MTDATDPAAPKPDAALDVEAEEARLEEIKADDERIRAQAEADLEVGGRGRTFADEGVREQVAERGDTDRAPGDGT
ncbi:hypothetical protein KSP35_08740 [Aquihabitans sp. G128]|uniref:hypothetical protein n=1 Tax=Aquihabitans sp. G128 TaxID=2849779 RepID=UPI001C21BBA8|nr:hypothetical protein [Aquihabitans sp. G128]QXC62849.1 hypothetical protein KSP35_08740 [Aquihabitans sp. G128]